MDAISALFADSTKLNTVVTVIGIVVGIIGIIVAIKSNFISWLFSWIQLIVPAILSGNIVVKNDYYSSKFVLHRINRASYLIRIVCVRTQRVTEADVIESLRKFITEKKGKVEILGINPCVNDYVIGECMCVLPSAPLHVDDFRKQVEANYSSLFTLYHSLGNKEKARLKYFEYNALPIIHMCQFDNNIYLGLQLYDRDEVENSLLSYSIRIKASSHLGRKIIKQCEYLRDSKSRNVFESTEYNGWVSKSFPKLSSIQ